MEYIDSSGKETVLRLVDKIAPYWERVGIALNIEHSARARYRRDFHDSRERVINMLTDWMEDRHRGDDSSRSVTWAALLQALKESNEHETARELEDALAYCTTKPSIDD